MSCGKCGGEWDTIFNIDEPEMCSCAGAMTMGRTRVTARWLRKLRRTKWEDEVKWDPHDEDRTWLSSEVLPEDLQDYQIPMVIMGFATP